MFFQRQSWHIVSASGWIGAKKQRKNPKQIHFNETNEWFFLEIVYFLLRILLYLNFILNDLNYLSRKWKGLTAQVIFLALCILILKQINLNVVLWKMISIGWYSRLQHQYYHLLKVKIGNKKRGHFPSLNKETTFSWKTHGNFRAAVELHQTTFKWNVFKKFHELFRLTIVSEAIDQLNSSFPQQEWWICGCVNTVVRVNVDVSVFFGVL